MIKFNRLDFISVTILGIIVSIFSFYSHFLFPIIPVLFITYAIISIWAIIVGNGNAFILVSLLAVPFTEHFGFNNILFSQSFFLLLCIIGIFYNRILLRKDFMYPLTIILIIILISFGKVSFNDFFSGFSLIHFLVLIPLFSTFNINKKSLISYAYIPLIFLGLYAYQLIYKPLEGFNYNRLGGYVFHANAFALVLNINIIILLNKFLIQNKKVDLIIVLIYAFLVILTESRTGFVSMVFGIFISMVLYFGSFRINYKIYLFTFIFFILVLVFINSDIFLNSRYSMISEQELESNRIYIWRDVFKQINSQIYTGLGLGGYNQIIEQIKNQRTPHNYFITLIANIGLVGLVLVLHYLFIVFRKVYLFTKNNYSELYLDDKILGISSISIFFMLLIASITNSSSFSIYSSLMFFVIISYMYNLSNKRSIKS